MTRSETMLTRQSSTTFTSFARLETVTAFLAYLHLRMGIIHRPVLVRLPVQKARPSCFRLPFRQRLRDSSLIIRRAMYAVEGIDMVEV